MRLPAPLSRLKPNVHKNDFGHVLILAGSKKLLGAACLSGLAAMRTGAGLVTVGVPASLNATLQKKISPVIMTLPLAETNEQTLSVSAYPEIEDFAKSVDVLALGPGLSRNPSTRDLVLSVIRHITKPLVIDADALNALSGNTKILKSNCGLKILTPHPGEMARLTKLTKAHIEKNRVSVAKNFAQRYHCILVLKGHHTVLASATGKTYVNKTGNPGMATAGSGDVLTGILAALLAQGLDGFASAKMGTYLHGKAGDLATIKHARASLIATDLIEHISAAIRSIEKTKRKYC
ncbi:MAG: NAD(P)H-hydrate dehydratase [Candidatus Omnitrophota bacterium]